MGTHTVHTDCVKCRAKDSLVFSYSTKDPLINDIFCLNCGWQYKMVEGKLKRKELAELRKEYDWSG